MTHEPRKKPAPPNLERSILPSERVPGTLPFRTDLEEMFRAELRNVRAYVGAERSLAALGARAAAEGDVVAFADRSPQRSLVAHEVAHVLQARTSERTGDAEREARQVEAAVAIGAAVPDIITSSSGVQFDLDDNGEVVFADESSLGFKLRPALEKIDFLSACPLATFIHFDGSGATFPNGSDYFASDVIWTIFPDGVLHAEIRKGLAPYLLPETIAQIWTRAQEAALKKQLPAREDAVAWEIVNVLVRRILESIPRVLPAIAALRAANKYSFQSIDVSAVPASHPMDRPVAKALSRSFFSITPEYYAVFGVEAPKSNIVYDNVTLKPAEHGLYHWVVASPPDATAFEVSKAMFGREDMAFRLIARPPLWGFPHDALDDMTDQDLVEALHRYARENHPHAAMINSRQVTSYYQSDFHTGLNLVSVASGFRFQTPEPVTNYGLPVDDPILEMTRAEHGGAPRSAAPSEPRTDTEVAQRFKDLLDNLQKISTWLLKFAIDVRAVIEMSDYVQSRMALANGHLIGANGAAYYDVASEQLAIVSDVATDVEKKLAPMLAEYLIASEAKSITDVDASLSSPLKEAATAYAEVIAGIDAPDVARERLAHAQQLERDISITVIEAGLHASADATDDVAHPYVGPDKQAFEPEDLRLLLDARSAELAKLRVLQLSDPAAAVTAMTTARDNASAVEFEITIASTLDALDAYWRYLDDAKSFWSSVYENAHTDQLKEQNRAFYHLFHDGVWALYNMHDQASRDVARATFKVFVPLFQEHLKEVASFVTEELDHQKWRKLAAMIAITIVSFGVGAEVSVIAVEELGWGTFAARALGAAADFGTATTLNAAVLQQLPTAGQAATQVLTFGAVSLLQKASALGRIAGLAEETDAAIVATVKAGRAGKVLAAAGELTRESIMATVIGFAGAKLTTKIDTGKWTAEDEVGSLRDGAIQAIAMTLAGRLHARMMGPRIKALAIQHQIEFESIYTERARLDEESRRIDTTRERALDLVERVNKNLAREDAVIKRLRGLAALHPEQFKDAMSELEKMARANELAEADIKQATVLVGIEQVGPNEARADMRVIDDLVIRHREQGGSVTRISTDADGLRTITIQPKAGAPIEIREKPLGHGEQGPARPPLEVAHEFEKWLGTVKDPELAQGIRDAYVADPQQTIARARAHGFDGAPDYQPHVGEGVPLEVAKKLGDRRVQALNERDFAALERAGFRFDPIKRRFVEVGVPRGPSHPLGEPNTVVGELPSQAAGRVVLEMLASNDANALRVAGIEPPANVRTDSHEWGIGRRRSDDKIVLVHGTPDGVHWREIPDVEALDHSHPYEATPARQLGGTADGHISVEALRTLTAPASDLAKLLPSGPDLVFAASHGGEHGVVGPYVLRPDGTIGNPSGSAGEILIVIEIRNPQLLGVDEHGSTHADADVVVSAGAETLMTQRLRGTDLETSRLTSEPPPKLTPFESEDLPGTTPAAIEIDEAKRAKMVAKLKDSWPLLANELRTNERVAIAMHYENYNIEALKTAWAEYWEFRRKGNGKAESFSDYLKNNTKYKTFAGPESTPLTTAIPGWDNLKTQEERQSAVVKKAAPTLDTELGKRRSSILPKETRDAIDRVLAKENLIPENADWDKARGAVMGRIDALLLEAMKNPAKVAPILGLFASDSGRLGSLGEQYVSRYLSRGKNDLLKHPSFVAGDIPGFQGDKSKLNPDYISKGVREALEVKTGYENTAVNPVQAVNTDKFLDATRSRTGAPAILALRKTLGGRGLERNNYLILPVTDETKVARIAQEKHDQLAGLSVGEPIRVFYLKDGRIWLVNGPAKSWGSIQAAMETP